MMKRVLFFQVHLDPSLDFLSYSADTFVYSHCQRHIVLCTKLYSMILSGREKSPLTIFNFAKLFGNSNVFLQMNLKLIALFPPQTVGTWIGILYIN